jgi:hypothetical protein
MKDKKQLHASIEKIGTFYAKTYTEYTNKNLFFMSTCCVFNNYFGFLV